MTRRCIRAAATVSVLSLLVPAAALAHGLNTDTADRSLAGYLWLGIRHMIGGWDHLLFIAGIVILAGATRGAAKLISLFVAGHSITLLTATLAGWQINPDVVDILIASSVAFIGWRVLLGRPQQWWPTAAAIFAFGLVHGLGLASRLQELDLPTGGALVARIVAFNIGIEIGQLTALSVLVGVGVLLVRHIRDTAPAHRIAATLLVGAGLFAALLLTLSALITPPSEAEPVSADCTQRSFEPGQTTLEAKHPQLEFYAPDHAPDENDLNHVMGDGYLIVRYRPTLTNAWVQRLRDWFADGPRGVIVAPGPADQDAITDAQTRDRALACTTLDLAQLTRFRDAWFADLRP